MSEKSINDLFENQSPKGALSPFKRTNPHQFNQSSKKQTCDRYKKIVVQDTPSPFMINKKSEIAETDTAKEKKTFESSIKITKRVIPNTPVVVKNNLSINSKKVKKLFDKNLLLLEDLPGNEDRIKLIDDGKKVSSLFKPRSVVHCIENQFCQNDMSYEEKKSRRRNPLITRLSDIEPLNLNKNDETEKSNEEKNSSSPIIDLQKRDLFDSINEERDISSSPIVVLKKTNFINTKIEKTIEVNESKLTSFNYTNSFTHVSEINYHNKNQNTHEHEVKSLFDSDSYSQAVDENKIDQILFDGLKITDLHDKKSNCKSNKIKVGLFDKTNTTNVQKSKYAKNKSVFNNNTKKCKPKSLDSDVIFPKKHTSLNIAHLNLNENQKEKVKQIIDHINYEQSKSSKWAVFQNKLQLNTSHLLVDFEAVLYNNKLKTIQKLTLILALIKNCKIIRFEWLIHSESKRKWCSEDQYTLESYIDIDLDNFEDQNEFDIRLVKLERNLKLTDRVDLFSKYGNIFLLSCESENFNGVSFSDSFFKSKNCLYDYFHELITRCNGLITSRAACANLIILIDTSDDYETSTKHGANQVLQEAIKFKKVFKEIKEKLIKCKIKKKINIISSNWIIESVLDIHLKNHDDYVICCYEGYD